MRIRVKCVNCGLIYDRVTIGFGGDVELTEDLCYNCPKCGSNAYERLSEEKKEKLEV